MNRILQHYRNGRDLGDNWLYITRMALLGKLLTDKKYKAYFAKLNKEEPLSVEESNQVLEELGFNINNND